MIIHIFSPTSNIFIYQESNEFDSVLSDNKKTKQKFNTLLQTAEGKKKKNFRCERHVFYRNSPTLD